MGNRRLVVAFDYDGTLVSNSFPGAGVPNMEMFALVKTVIARGHHVVLHTCREGKWLQDAVALCSSYSVFFHAINENTSELKALGYTSRKPYADLYIDDKGVGDITEVQAILRHILYLEENVSALPVIE